MQKKKGVAVFRIPFFFRQQPMMPQMNGNRRAARAARYGSSAIFRIFAA